MMFYRGDLLGREIAQAMGLEFSVIAGLVEQLKRVHAISAKSSLGIGDASSIFSLSETGRSMAKDHLETNQYVGPAPVPLHQYSCVVKLQRPPQVAEQESAAARLPQHGNQRYMFAQIGPAVSSAIHC